MATLKDAIEYSRQNPKSDFARLLKQRIQSGDADADFAKEGIDPALFGRPNPERQAMLGRLKGEAEATETAANEANSFGGIVKNTIKNIGEATGFTPTGRRIAAGVAPFVVPEKELPGVVEELVGGVTTPAPHPVKEFADIALDLPLPSFGVSKSIANTTKNVLKSSGVDNLLTKDAIDLVPKTTKDFLTQPVKVPEMKNGVVKALTGGTGEGAADPGISTVEKIRRYYGTKNANPQLKTSAGRLAEKAPLQGAGAAREATPLDVYNEFAEQEAKHIGDIKNDPAVSMVGERIGDAFTEVVRKRRDAGRVMQSELEKIGSVKTDVGTHATDFTNKLLKEQKLVYNSKTGKLLGTAAQSPMTSGDRRMVEGYMKNLAGLGKKPTVADLDSFIKRATGDLDLYKSRNQIMGSTNGERIIKNSLAELRKQFDPKSNAALEKYAAARKEYADLSGFVEEGVRHLGKLTQSGDFARDASLAKSAVQSVLNNGKKDWLIKLEDLTGYPALDEAALSLQAMKDAGDYKGNSLLELLSGDIAKSDVPPTSIGGVLYNIGKSGYNVGKEKVVGSPAEQTRAYLKSLNEAARKPKK